MKKLLYKALVKLGIIKEYPISIYRDELGRTTKIVMNGKTTLFNYEGVTNNG